MGVWCGSELTKKDLLTDLVDQLKSVPAHFPEDTELQEGINAIKDLFEQRIKTLVDQAIQREKQSKSSSIIATAKKSSRQQGPLRGVDGPDTFWDTFNGRCELVMP